MLCLDIQTQLSRMSRRLLEDNGPSIFHVFWQIFFKNLADGFSFSGTGKILSLASEILRTILYGDACPVCGWIKIINAFFIEFPTRYFNGNAFQKPVNSAVFVHTVLNYH